MTTTGGTPPRVVRIRRIKGQIVQGCDVYIGNTCKIGGWNLPKSKWSNPCNGVSKFESTEVKMLSLEFYEKYIKAKPELLAAIVPELEGKILGCWCLPGEPCHGHVLVKLYRERAGGE